MNRRDAAPMTLAELPDALVLWSPTTGEVTAGEIRREQKPALDDEWEATLEMWGDIVTRNLCRKPWEPRVSVSDIKAYHAAQYSAAQTRRASKR